MKGSRNRQASFFSPAIPVFKRLRQGDCRKLYPAGALEQDLCFQTTEKVTDQTLKVSRTLIPTW